MPRLWDLGHLRPLFYRGILDAYLGWALEERDDFVIWAGLQPHGVVTRPESVLRVVGTDHTFNRNAAPTVELSGLGLLRQEGEPSADTRRLFAPAFRVSALEPAVAIVQEECGRLIATWTQKTEVKPTRDLSFLMLRVLGRVLFGYEFDEERHGGRPLHRALITLASSTFLFHVLPEALVRARIGGDLRRARGWLDALCTDILATGGDTPLMTALRGAIARGEMSERVALDNIRGLLIAGHETSATATAWSVALLAQQTDQAEAVRAERDASSAASCIADVDALAAAGRWSQETMRLFPPVPLSVSQATVDTQLGPLRVPKGTRVDVCSYLLHRLPGLWVDPAAFRPERFGGRRPRGPTSPFCTARIPAWASASPRSRSRWSRRASPAPSISSCRTGRPASTFASP